MARYLVTGGCGFIGSHLAEALLAQGHDVRILDELSTGKCADTPAAVDFMTADVANPEATATAMRDVDGCFHLAAISSVARSDVDWIAAHRTNVTGAVTVLDAARYANPKGPVRVVYASSAAVFGDNPGVPLGEKAVARPLSFYGAAKLACELYAHVAGAIHGVPTCGLRFFNVYGPRQDPASPYSGVISTFCDRLKEGRPVNVFGDGLQTRDFIYIDDVVRALVTAMRMNSREPEVFCICTGRATSIIALAHIIGSILGVAPILEFRPARPGDIRVSIGDPTSARDRMGFAYDTNLEDGLVKMLGAARCRQ